MAMPTFFLFFILTFAARASALLPPPATATATAIFPAPALAFFNTFGVLTCPMEKEGQQAKRRGHGFPHYGDGDV